MNVIYYSIKIKFLPCLRRNASGVRVQQTFWFCTGVSLFGDKKCQGVTRDVFMVSKNIQQVLQKYRGRLIVRKRHPTRRCPETFKHRQNGFKLGMINNACIFYRTVEIWPIHDIKCKCRFLLFSKMKGVNIIFEVSCHHKTSQCC